MSQYFVNKGFVMQLGHRLLTTTCLCISLSAQAVTLDEVIEIALKIDPTLRASKFNSQATEENIALARAKLLPQVSLQGTSSQLTQTTIQDLPTGGSSSRSFAGPSVNHQLVMRQAIFRPKDLSSLRYAELQTEYMQLKYKFDLAELKSRVSISWIELIGAQQIAFAYQKPLTSMKIAAMQERAKLEQGEGTKDVMMEADAQYENAKATYQQAIEALKAKQISFEKLTTISSDQLANKKYASMHVNDIPEAEKLIIWENLRNTSLELQMAKLQELMQLERVRIAEADHKPTLDLIASVNIAQNDATSTQGYQYKNSQLGIQYILPLYLGGGVNASIKQAYYLYESSKLESQIQYSRIENDFNSSWSQLLGVIKRKNAMIKSIISAEEQLNAANKGFDLGVKTVNDIAVSEMNLTRRKAEYIFLTQDYHKLKLKLKLMRFDDSLIY
jgi:protease secretion system outer membrane protein